MPLKFYCVALASTPPVDPNQDRRRVIALYLLAPDEQAALECAGEHFPQHEIVGIQLHHD